MLLILVIKLYDLDVRLEVFTAVRIHVEFFWVVTLCSVVVGYQHFRGLCCLFTLKMEAAWASETLIFYHKNSQHHSQEDPNLNL
jgi:hypothetical protein